MLPLSLLKSATGCPILIELKNGETYNAKLHSMDLWMNMSLTDAVRTSRDGNDFWHVPQLYIRGNTIKYIRVPELVLGIVEEERAARQQRRADRSNRSSGGSRRSAGGGRNRHGGRRDRRDHPQWQ
ncbi:putative U6 snRNA-associated Sm-like protein LSm4 [Gracilariopsis chorda]|uniref:U6 snRNA-associated Sm-like protein LSm4 n=1 Tax=Gracilariopsis chorda TaxID=448386 RepID=A0A2V3J6V1_9FLOR|nr:putative U6 snRNA-associated Sm-like protein LSm4 [Gracilariopsis chorda]|eukprot:PXF49727.1 putative U6 snRNA-associated Sm-like protein LSm4 [Gracilariopsis chorda]